MLNHIQWKAQEIDGAQTEVTTEIYSQSSNVFKWIYIHIKSHWAHNQIKPLRRKLKRSRF